jgi:DNA-binding FadR family transcriptional regulator
MGDILIMPGDGRSAGGKKARGGKKGNVLRLHGVIARDIGMAIVSGGYKPGAILEGEVEASGRRKVSRGAYREAVRILCAKGLVESRPKIGTRVSAREDWHLLDPDVLAWVFAGNPDASLLKALFELRQMVEPAATALAATRRNETDLREMRRALDAMRRHTLQAEAGQHADREFHAALLRATGNSFVASLTKGIVAAVEATTIFKQRERALSRDAIPDHAEVYKAVAASDPERAKAAMETLIRQAYLDTPAHK